jgi:hypothetical protein
MSMVEICIFWHISTMDISWLSLLFCLVQFPLRPPCASGGNVPPTGSSIINTYSVVSDLMPFHSRGRAPLNMLSFR